MRKSFLLLPIRSFFFSSSEYFEYFGPDFTLHPDVSTKIENQNPRSYLDSIKQAVIENLRVLPNSPSVQMQHVPPDMLSMDIKAEPDPDQREGQEDIDKRLVGQVCVYVCMRV